MKPSLILLVVCNCHLQGVFSWEYPDIAYRREDSLYAKIYDDSGTGAWSDVSIWHPVTFQNGFFPLGDVALEGHSQPSSSSILVKDMSGDALRPPVGFTEVWNDKGSKGDMAVRIMSMKPPSGYICLGHVAVIGYGNEPDKNSYRCVKEEHVTTGKYESIWCDEGSKAYDAVKLWSNRVSDSDTYALDANTFTSFDNWKTPEGSPYMLDGRQVKDILDTGVNDLDFYFTVYEVSDLEEIYNDKGTKADKALSVWRSKGPANTFSLGDIAINGYKKSVGFVVKAHNESFFDAPYDFTQVWNDAGSKGDWDGAFWRPLCNAGYRALGHVAVRSEESKPDKNSIRCVDERYTVLGDWEYVWNDKGSGAYDPVSIYRANAGADGQGVGASTSFGNYKTPDTNAYVLNAELTNYIFGPPAVSYTLKNLVYHFDDYQMGDQKPDYIKRTTLDNKGSTNQTATRSVNYEYSETYSWSNSVGGEIGVEMTVKAGIPFFASEEITTSAVGTYSHDWGGETSETFSDSIEVAVNVLPCSTKDAIVTGWQYKMDVPFTATMVTTYEDGSTGVREDFDGIFRGVEISQVYVEYDPDIPIPGGC